MIKRPARFIDAEITSKSWDMDFLNESLMNEWFSTSDNYQAKKDPEQLEHNLPYTQQTNVPRLDDGLLPKPFHGRTQFPENFDSGLDELLFFPLESHLFEPPAPSSNPALDAMEPSHFPNMNEIPPHSSQTTNEKDGRVGSVC